MEISATERRLRERYGELLTVNDLVAVFRYSSAHAVRRAHKLGTLPVELHRFDGQRRWFATVTSVATALEKLTRR